MILEQLQRFLDAEQIEAGQIDNERALQLEIGLMFRHLSYSVQFEVMCPVRTIHPKHTKPQKRDLDLLISGENETLAVELKAPFSGRVPETMYDFYSDIAFIEAVVREGIADTGACLMLTNDSAFWGGRDSSGIYGPLRVPSTELHGEVRKPTGKKDSAIFVMDTYRPVWRNLGNQSLLQGGRYTLIRVCNTSHSRIPLV